MVGKSSIVLGIVVSLLLIARIAALAAEPPGGEQALLAKYPTLKTKLEKNQFRAPIYLESVQSNGSAQVDVYGIINHPFDLASNALQAPANWCDITSLHINIKACTYRKVGGQWLLTLYSGRKFYQTPDQGYPLKLKFRILSQQPGYLSETLTADQGPLHTKDHRMKLEAAPLDKGRTFVHFSYAYSFGAMARMATKSYLATIGRDKVGFSTVPGAGGKLYYIEGVRGAIERNTVRYYLAIETYMDTLAYPENQRFEQRLNRWYDLTAKYTRQLKEMEKGEYLAMKRREHANQLALQRKQDGG